MPSIWEMRGMLPWHLNKGYHAARKNRNSTPNKVLLNCTMFTHRVSEQSPCSHTGFVLWEMKYDSWMNRRSLSLAEVILCNVLSFFGNISLTLGAKIHNMCDTSQVTVPDPTCSQTYDWGNSPSKHFIAPFGLGVVWGKGRGFSPPSPFPALPRQTEQNNTLKVSFPSHMCDYKIGWAPMAQLVSHILCVLAFRQYNIITWSYSSRSAVPEQRSSLARNINISFLGITESTLGILPLLC